MASRRYKRLPSGHKEQLGPELVVNGDFSAWTADNPDGWSVFGESLPNTEVSEVGSGEGHGGTGTGSCNFYTTGVNIYTSQDILNPFGGTRYKIVIKCSFVSGGTLSIGDDINSTCFGIISATGIHTLRGINENLGNLFQIKRTGAATNITIDSVSVKEILVEGVDEILSISAQSGSILDRWGNTLTNTATTVYKDGPVNAMSFDGATSKVNCGTPDTLVGDKSFILWVKGHKYSGAATYLIGNTQFALAFNTPDNLLSITSDGGGTIANDAYTLPLDIWTLIIAVRNAAGLIDFYVNGEIVYSALDTGTPAAGTDIIINSEPTSFKGLMNDVRIKDGLITASEASQIFLSEKSLYRL